MEERGGRGLGPPGFMNITFEHNEQRNRGRKTPGEQLESVAHFKYIRTSIKEECGKETEITKRVRAGWINWNE